ncbi:MAG: helix-turn-helix transcriptional regulator [Lachnospiraceae bacterium]|nr:helix-turn-helix transcriptional regulator [Lachnospiraceae bacterium]
MKNFTGFIIRQQRLAKGMSQEALCRGICAVSYLSKIEQGIGNPSPAILQQLLDALGINYNQNEAMLEKAQMMLRSYFDKYFHSETAEEETSYLKLHQQEMENSELHLSWHLFNLFMLIQKYGKSAPVCHQEAAYIGRFKEYLEDDQLFAYYVGTGLIEGDDQLENLRLAETIRPIAFVKQSIAECYYARREYMNAIDAAGRAYAAAAEEGSMPTLLWSSYLLGACYSNFNDMSFMLKYYKRALELSRGYDATISSLIQYNIGSAYLEHKNFQDAVPYLLTSMQPSDSSLEEQKVLAGQKLATCYFEQGFASLGHQFLQQAANRRTDRMPTVYEELLYFTRLRYVDNDRSSEEYENVLKDLYANGGEALGDSYRRIFADYLVELYMAQRKYKDALAIKSEYGYV